MKFQTNQTFKWDNETCVPRFYQATGKCEDPNSNGCKKASCDTPQQVTSIVTVMACSTSEACQKIKSKFKDFKIDKLFKFDKPALKRDDDGSDVRCFTEVSPSEGGCDDSEGGSDSSDSSETLIEDEMSLIAPLKKSEPTFATEYEPASDHRRFAMDPSPDRYVFWGSGNIEIYGGAEIEASDVGELTMTGVFTDELTNLGLVQSFAPITLPPLPEVTGSVQSACSSAVFPLVLEFRHNLNRVKPFAGFLKTNGLSVLGQIMPNDQNGNFIKLNYNVNNDQWQGNVFLQGQSPAGEFTESWNLLVQLACEVDYWKFSLAMSNNQPSKKHLSRLLCYYKADAFCPSDVFFGFKFAVDQAIATPTTSQPVVINDAAGFFRDLRMTFRILPQNRGTGSYQSSADNTVAFDATLTGGT